MIKEILLFTAVFIYIALGLLVHFAAFFSPVLRFRIISGCTRVMCALLKGTLGIKVIIAGNNRQPAEERGSLIIANHQGYLDGIVLGGIFGGVFVSKLQVKSWPVFGWMSRIGGTIFINREKKLKSAASLEEISRMLRNKINVIIFPEGTSTDGTKILPFQSIFFQAPLDSGRSVMPVTIQYTKINSQEASLANRDKVCWYGQKKFFRHIQDVLSLKNIEVKVAIHPQIAPHPGDSRNPDARKQLSLAAYQAVSSGFSAFQ